MTTQDALDLRRTLQALKQGEAVDGDTQLAYATDKTLSRLNNELDAYEKKRREIISEHSETDEKQRRLVKVGGEKVAVDENEDHQVVAAYEPGTDEEVDLSSLSRRTENVLEDPQAVSEKLADIKKREEEGIHLHKVERSRFFDHADLEGLHGQVDLAALDAWFKTKGEQ